MMSDSDKDKKIKRRKATDYKQDTNNANKGSDVGRQMVRDSLRRYGAGRSVLADRDGNIIAGNKTIQQAIDEGMLDVIEIETDGDQLVVVRRNDISLDGDDGKARGLAYADNRASEVGLVWDPDVITQDIQAGVDLDWMFDPSELAMIAGNNVVYPDEYLPEGENDESDEGDDRLSPEDVREQAHEKWQVKTGDIWAIQSKNGEWHRVLCADCRDTDLVHQLFMDKQAQIAFTSPPYAQQRADDYGGIAEEDYVDWFWGVQNAVNSVLVDGGSFFINIKPHSRDGERVLYVFDLVLSMRREWGWYFVDEHCWRHSGLPSKPKNRLKNCFEPIYQFQKGDPFGGVFEPMRMGTQSDFIRDKDAETLSYATTGTRYGIPDGFKEGIALPRNVFLAQGTRGVPHSAMYPIKVPYRFMQIYSNPHDIIFDPFLGSGTNIHAAERCNRISYGVEMMPEHVSMILEEWHDKDYTIEKVN